MLNLIHIIVPFLFLVNRSISSCKGSRKVANTQDMKKKTNCNIVGGQSVVGLWMPKIQKARKKKVVTFTFSIKWLDGKGCGK